MLWLLIARVVALFPWRVLRHFGWILGRVAGSVVRIRRRHTVEALRRAGFEPAHRHADAVYESLATNVFELLWVAGRPRKRLDDLVAAIPEEWRKAREALALGRGVVVATAHTGNWDLLACAMASRFPLWVVTKHLSWKSLDRFWQALRADRGMKPIDTNTLRRAGDALRAGEVVAFLVDQAPVRQRGVLAKPFLGAAAQHDITFATIAARYRVPVLVALDQRLPDGTHLLRIPLVIEPPEKPSHAWAAFTCLRVATVLESFVRAHPDQWLWLHRRWRMEFASEAPSKRDGGVGGGEDQGVEEPRPGVLMGVDGRGPDSGRGIEFTEVFTIQP